MHARTHAHAAAAPLQRVPESEAAVRAAVVAAERAGMYDMAIKLGNNLVCGAHAGYKVWKRSVVAHWAAT